MEKFLFEAFMVYSMIRIDCKVCFRIMRQVYGVWLRACLSFGLKESRLLRPRGLAFTFFQTAPQVRADHAKYRVRGFGAGRWKSEDQQREHRTIG